MHRFGDSLWSFRVEESPELTKIAEMASTLAAVPSGLDLDRFRDLSDSTYLAMLRAALDEPPCPDVLDDKERLATFGKLTRRVGWEPGDELQPGDATVRFAYAQGYVRLLDREERLAPLVESVEEVFGQPCESRGDFLYPPGGFREWHSNQFDGGGWRMYLVMNDVPAASFFRIAEPATGRIHTAWDSECTVNFFRVDSAEPRWHCIRSLTATRRSMGFRVPATWQETLGV